MPLRLRSPNSPIQSLPSHQQSLSCGAKRAVGSTHRAWDSHDVRVVPARRKSRYAGISSKFQVFKTYNINLTGSVHGALIRTPSVESCCGKVSCVIKVFVLGLICLFRDFHLAGVCVEPLP